jgi:hypothetical protein
MTSHVHWNDEHAGRIASTRLSVDVRNADDVKPKGQKSDDLRAKIDKAVRVELAYLDKAIEMGKKRKMMVRVLNEQGNCNSSTTSETINASQQQKITANIAYATKLEKAYFHKARQVHDRRYRWTKLYEMSQNSDDSKADNSPSKSKLPPLMSSFYSGEEKLSTI